MDCCPNFVSLKKTVAILLLACLLCQCSVQLGILAWYNLNRSYVAAVLCENKSKPELNCCGKCYLRKQMKKTEEGTQEPGKGAPSRSVRLEIPEFIVAEAFQLPVALPVADIVYPPAATPQLIFRPAGDTFHPPSRA